MSCCVEKGTTDKSQLFHDLLLSLVPRLRSRAIALVRNQSKADDLVQEALLSAWQNQDSLSDMDRIEGWLFTIMRNAFRSSLRRRKFESDSFDSDAIEQFGEDAGQHLSCEVQETLEALADLAPELREALVFTTIDGLSYEETAQMVGCPVGTIKSRVNRARRELKLLLGLLPSDSGYEAIVAHIAAGFGKEARSQSSQRRFE